MVREVRQKLKLVQSGNRAQIMLDAQREFREKENKSESEGEGQEEGYGSTMKKGTRRMVSKSKKGVKNNNFMD